MSKDASRETPEGKRTQTRKGHTTMYEASHAHASRVRAVEANSPPPLGLGLADTTGSNGACRQAST
eukprot:6786419-Lingulodinium_polyedra.AAC.1